MDSDDDDPDLYATPKNPPRQGEGMPPAGCEPLAGCGIGGCLVPFLLMIAAGAGGDMGGPLFWPIIATPLGLIGMALGFYIRARKER